MSLGTQAQLDDWVFPKAEQEPETDEDEWLDCGHQPSCADERGTCVVCNVSQTAATGRDSMADITQDQDASSPFDGGGR